MAITIAQLLYSPTLDRRCDSHYTLSARVGTSQLLLASIVAMSVLFAFIPPDVVTPLRPADEQE